MICQGGAMEKVAASTAAYYPSVSAGQSSFSPQNTNDKSLSPRGHHSSINKAVEAHRSMVEERQSRYGRKELSLDEDSSVSASASDAYVAQAGSGNADAGSTNYNLYQSTLIESPSTQAKMASVQSFQSMEPDRPIMGEPIPKGSYLDVEA